MARRRDVLLVQGSVATLRWHGHGGPSLAMLGLIIVVAGVIPVAVGLLLVLARKLYRWSRACRLARRRTRDAALAEQRARAMMSELCPNGWRAQITLFEREDELPEDAPRRGHPMVALDWAELGDGRGRVAVMRRVWAATIVEALDKMVADRRTDETLEQIERAAEQAWPDL